MHVSAFGYGGLTALAAEVTGSTSGEHSLVVAIIAASGGVAAAVIGPFVTEYIRTHRKNLQRQKELGEVLLDDLAREREENRRLREQLNKKEEDQ